MIRSRLGRAMPAFALALLLAACGGGGGGDGGGGSGGGGSGGSPSTGGGTTTPLPPASVASAPAASTSSQPLVTLGSDAGEYIGQGLSYAYDTSNSSIQLKTQGAHLSVTVKGSQSWTGDFLLPGNLNQLKAGTYDTLVRYPFQTPGVGGLSWTGQGRGCNTVQGKLVINSAVYDAGLLQSLDMSFEQRCEGGTQALRGQIRVDAASMSRVMAPRNPQPDQPVVSLVSDAADYIGNGAAYAYDLLSAKIQVQNSGAHLSISIQGDETWNGEFVLPAAYTQWQVGSYRGLTRYPFNTAAEGGLSWWGEGRGCNDALGEITVNSVRYENGALAAINFDFVQYCDRGVPGLHGHVDWDSARPVPAPAPRAIPAGLWTPPEGQMAATGNAMYFSSDVGDLIGMGWTYWVSSSPDTGPPAGTPTDTKGAVTLAITEANGLLTITLKGAVDWSGQFKAMDGVAHLQPGYYGIVQRYPFQNPRLGGMNWTMDGRNCGQLSGWFAIDSVSYTGDTLTAVDLRFAQYCENSISALRGKVRWTVANTTVK